MFKGFIVGFLTMLLLVDRKVKIFWENCDGDNNDKFVMLITMMIIKMMMPVIVMIIIVKGLNWLTWHYVSLSRRIITSKDTSQNLLKTIFLTNSWKFIIKIIFLTDDMKTILLITQAIVKKLKTIDNIIRNLKPIQIMVKKTKCCLRKRIIWLSISWIHWLC